MTFLKSPVCKAFWFLSVLGFSCAALGVPQISAERVMHRGKNTDGKKICGGFAGIPCAEGQFCLTPPGQCCCDFQGMCVPQGDACPAIYDPVCGCDGQTYSNMCEAIKNSVNIDHFGECIRVCTGPGPAWLCTPEEFCKVPLGVCDPPGPVGVCTLPPQGCPDYWDPVCGCDGQTYSNQCDADAARVNVAYLGECDDECRPTSDGWSCQNLGCASPIPEVQCVPAVLHIDWSTGAIRVLDCNCQDWNYCRIYFGNASPYAMGGCPNNTGTCQVIGQDSDNDGLDDTFRAACQNTP